MRLIECYIENFGKLKGQTVSFKSGLNTLVRENGWGKSTLVAFIKAMLYGMPGDGRGSRDIEKNDRKRYTPWQGGAYGGTLTFSLNGKEYRIEREFGKNEKDDTFKLYDARLNKESFDFTDEIGKELFEINEEGFMRTVLLSDKMLEKEIRDKSIHTKLSNLVGVDGDVGNFEEAVKSLENQRKVYNPKSKTGSIAIIDNSLKEENQRLAEAQKCQERALELEGELSIKQKEIAALEASECELRRRSAAFMKKSGEITQLKEKREALEKARAELEGYEAFFKNGVPSFFLIDEHIATKRECEAGAGENRIPDMPYSRDEASKDSERLTYLAAEYDRVQRELYENSEGSFINTSAKEDIKKQSARLYIYIAIATSVAICGIALGALVSPILYAVCIAAVFPICLLLSNKTDAPLPEVKEDESNQREALTKKALELKNELDGIMAKYSLNGSYQYAKKRLDDLLFDIRVNEEAQKSLEVKRNALNEKLKKTNDFIALYPTMGPDPLNEIKTMLLNYEYDKITLERAKNAYDEFCRTHNVDFLDSELTDNEGATADELSATVEKLKNAREQRAVLEREYLIKAQAAEEIDSILANIDELKEKKEKHTDILDTIISAKEMLEAAKDSLVSKYIGATKDAFYKYLGAIGIDEGEIDSISLDTSFEVKKMDMGKTREKESYSRGTQDSFNLAIRFALIDSLYKSENPFIILDDPFAFLDDKKQKNALKAIKALAKEKQIIYLTCTEARA